MCARAAWVRVRSDKPKGGWEVLGTVLGQELVGLTYVPLFEYFKDHPGGATRHSSAHVLWPQAKWRSPRVLASVGGTRVVRLMPPGCLPPANRLHRRSTPRRAAVLHLRARR